MSWSHLRRRFQLEMVGDATLTGDRSTTSGIHAVSFRFAIRLLCPFLCPLSSGGRYTEEFQPRWRDHVRPAPADII